MRRWIKVAVAAAAVLGLGGYIAEPYAQDWWLVGRACDGALPRDSVAQLTPDDAQFTKGSRTAFRSSASTGAASRTTGTTPRMWR